MDDTTLSHDMRDTDMSEAAADDPDLQLGEVSWFQFANLFIEMHLGLFECMQLMNISLCRQSLWSSSRANKKRKSNNAGPLILCYFVAIE